MTEKNRRMEHTDEARQKNSRQTEDTAAAQQARRESTEETAAARQERIDSAEDGLNVYHTQPILTAIYVRENLDENKCSESRKDTGDDTQISEPVVRQLEVLQTYIETHPSFQLAGIYTDRIASGIEASSGSADAYMSEVAVTVTGLASDTAEAVADLAAEAAATDTAEISATATVTDTAEISATATVTDTAEISATATVTDAAETSATVTVTNAAETSADLAVNTAATGTSDSSFNNAGEDTMAPATAALLSTFPAISDFPEMLRLLEDVRTGKIHCILVCKFTDFCKTRMETVYYIENLFRYLNVRFIAVEEDFDSDRAEDMRRIEALSREKMENTRAHNLSRLRCERAKERATRPDAMPSGSAPYGYLVSSDGKSYVVDQEVAPFVRMIFKWAAAGMSSPRIAQRMQLLGVETPGQRRLGKAPDPSKWDAHVVLKILQNPNYTGDIYIGRMQQALYKSQARRRTAPDEWVVRENTHEPLVTREDFKKVQEIIASNDRSGSGRRNASG